MHRRRGVVQSVRHVAQGRSWISRETLGRALKLRRVERDAPPAPQTRAAGLRAR